jgi:cell filamentation protein
MTLPRTWEEYFYPGTDVLRNTRGTRNAAALRTFEEQAARLRMAEIHAQTAIAGGFDRAHMQAIHRHIFQDVYDWAGEIRPAPLPVLPGRG